MRRNQNTLYFGKGSWNTDPENIYLHFVSLKTKTKKKTPVGYDVLRYGFLRAWCGSKQSTSTNCNAISLKRYTIPRFCKESFSTSWTELGATAAKKIKINKQPSTLQNAVTLWIEKPVWKHFFVNNSARMHTHCYMLIRMNMSLFPLHRFKLCRTHPAS